MIYDMIVKFIDWLDTTKAWEEFFKTLNKYNIRFKGYMLFPMSDYFKIMDKLTTNDHYIFLSTDTKSLSSIVIKGIVQNFSTDSKGYFSHAGVIFFKGDRDTTIMHMRDVGLIEQPLIDFLKRVDYFAVIKLPIKKNSDDIVHTRIESLRKVAKYIEYDWEQHLDNDQNKIYCSEMIYNLYKELVDSPNFHPRKIMDRDVFDPDTLLQCGDLVYCNHPDIKII